MKKHYKIFLIVLAFLLIISTFSYLEIHKNNEFSEATLLKTFNYSGAKIVSREIYFWSKLDSSYSNTEKIKAIADDFSNQLGLKKSDLPNGGNEKNDMTQKLEVSGSTLDNSLVSICAQLFEDKDNKGESYISLNISQDSEDVELEGIKQKVLKIFNKYKLEPKVNSCITGNLVGKRETNQLNDICKKIFSAAEAKTVEGIRDSELISVSAYSPFMDDSINVNGKKVNLNLAIRYNSYEDKTYIWLATPVITVEY
jgi:hypothetical protein